MTKTAIVSCAEVVAQMVEDVKARKAALEKAAKAEGKKEAALSKDQVAALLKSVWDDIPTARLIDAALAEAGAQLGL